MSFCAWTTRLASLIKLVIAWLSHNVPHHSDPTQRKMPKPHSRKAGFARPLIWVAIDIPSTHFFTKGNGGKNPSFFYLRTTEHWVQNKATNKNECQKGRKKGENVENGEKQPLKRCARLRESSIVWMFLFATAGVGFQRGLRHITCFTSTTERAKREPKLGLNGSRSLWSQIKPPHRSLIQRPFFLLHSPSLSFHSWEAFVYCTNEPVIRLLHFLLKKKSQDTNSQMDWITYI